MFSFLIKKTGVSRQITVAYILMSRRRKIDYEMVFRAVYELVKSRAHVECFVMDFEVAIWTSLRELNVQRVLSPVPIKERMPVPLVSSIMQKN